MSDRGVGTRRPPREIELKFTLDPSRGPEILRWLGQGRRQIRTDLTSIYFDTADHALRKAGFALRLRTDGKTWIQTVKSRAAEGGGPGRGEWEGPVSGSAPDIDALRRTPARTALKSDARLRPQFMVTVTRQAVDIRSPDGIIEACLDEGVIEGGARYASLHEIELELKAGNLTMLFSLARRLRETFPLGLSVVSKADRGFALAEHGGLAARGFERPRLSPDLSTGRAFQVMARAALDQILWNAELLGDRPTNDAIHQTRVGVRRLRATMATFKPIISDSRTAEIKAGLKTLSAALDPARNLDVFVGGDWGRAAAQSDPHIEAARLAAHERARDSVRDDATRARLLETLIWIETGPWTQPGAGGAARRDRSVTRFAARALEKGRERLLEKGARLERQDVESRHRVRIEAKGLRYAADVFDQLFDEHPKRARRFLGTLETLQEALGDLNDAATARVVASDFPEAANASIPQAGRERELLAAAARAFRDFKAAAPYWD